VRSDIQEAAAVFAPARPARTASRSVGKWLALLFVLAALAAAGWYERGPIQRMWKRSFGPPPSPVIAVIPFDTDPSQTFFADGLAEDLTTRLGQTPGLKVIGRSGARQYRGHQARDVARELGAAVVLTGSVRPGRHRRGLAGIDRSSDGAAIWSASTRDVKDIFAVQVQVAGEVAQALPRRNPRPQARARRASWIPAPTSSTCAAARPSRTPSAGATAVRTRDRGRRRWQASPASRGAAPGRHGRGRRCRVVNDCGRRPSAPTSWIGSARGECRGQPDGTRCTTR
jgi:TolB-like protein